MNRVLVTDLSMVVLSCFLFLCYIHSSCCCIDKTPFVATTRATTINLSTPTTLHAVAPHCTVPIPSLCWSCWWQCNFPFPTQLFTQFLLQGLLSGFTVYCCQSLVQFIITLCVWHTRWFFLMLSLKFQHTAFPLRKHMMRPGIATVKLYHTELQEWYTAV